VLADEPHEDQYGRPGSAAKKADAAFRISLARRNSRASAQSPVGRFVPHPAGVPSQHRVLMPEHQHLSRCRLVAAGESHDQAEYPASQYVDDLEQHRPNHHHVQQSATAQVNHTTEYSSGTGSCTPPGNSSAAAAAVG
jgi:hypothetical protein